MKKSITISCLIFALFFITTNWAPITAQTSWIVTNANDDGVGSLRAQIDSAGIADTIRFSPAINGDSIKLSSGEITRFDDLIILGNGEQNTIIDGSLNSNSRLFLLSDDIVNDTSMVEFRNLTLQRGSNPQSGSSNGGAIRARSNAKFINCTFSHNSANSGTAGAVECLFGNFRFVNCTFFGNSAVVGGVTSSFRAQTSFVNCLIYDNVARDAGAINIGFESHCTLINNTITNNHGTRVVGGVQNTNQGSMELYNNIISGNTTDGTPCSTNADFKNQNAIILNASQNIIFDDCGSGTTTGFIEGYPDFVDTASNNFQLLDLSLGIDLADVMFLPIDSFDADDDGNITEVIDIDIAGNQRINRCALDIGAFENQTISFCPPNNDLCENAMLIDCGEFVIDSTDFATLLDVNTPCGVSDTSAGLWYSILGTGDSTVITTADSATDFDTQIQVFSGSCGSLVCIGGDDNSGTGNTSLFSFTPVLDTVYQIYISGAGSTKGRFKLSIDCIDPCPSVRNINGTLASTEFYADSVINSDASILSPIDVLFQSGNEINLNAPFEVELGARFNAVIGDCP